MNPRKRGSAAMEEIRKLREAHTGRPVSQLQANLFYDLNDAVFNMAKEISNSRQCAMVLIQLFTETLDESNASQVLSKINEMMSHELDCLTDEERAEEANKTAKEDEVNKAAFAVQEALNAFHTALEKANG